jgi:hypothetical protein
MHVYPVVDGNPEHWAVRDHLATLSAVLMPGRWPGLGAC